MSESWKNYLRLKYSKHRKKEGKFLLEGWRLLQEALKTNWPLEVVFATEAFLQKEIASHLTALLEKKNIPLRTLSESNLKRLADTETPQGILAVVEKPLRKATFPEALRTGNPVVLLDGVSDPGNLGTIIRAADWFGAALLVANETSADFFNPKVIRSSMGSIFHLPLLREKDLTPVIQALKTQGYRVAATSSHSGIPPDALPSKKQLALLIGSEAHGIQPALRNQTDLEVMIPRKGKAESLNAAVAAAILLYEITK